MVMADKYDSITDINRWGYYNNDLNPDKPPYTSQIYNGRVVSTDGSVSFMGDISKERLECIFKFSKEYGLTFIVCTESHYRIYMITNGIARLLWDANAIVEATEKIGIEKVY